MQAGATAHIASRVVAPILSIHVREGDRVRRSQTLVTLDARELTANAERAEAAGTSATEASRAAEARATAAETARTLAGTTHSRIKTLSDKRSATPQELDQAFAALQAAEAQLASARADAAAAAAARDASHAAAEAARVARSYSVLTAPFDGVVVSRLADPGSLASPGQPLMVVEQSGAARLDIRIDESSAARTKVGDRAEVRLDSTGDAPWIAATVIEIGRADASSHSVLMKLQLPAGTTARTGSFGRARLGGEPRRTLITPSSSILRRAGLTFVFVLDADTRARLRPVITGAVDADGTEILAGVSDGSTVVLDPPPGLADGSRVSASRAPRVEEPPQEPRR